jgi:ribosomal protein L31
VDIWSGNHPFFQGVKTAVMTNAGRVSRFGDRFGDLGAMSEVETMDKAMARKDEEESK